MAAVVTYLSGLRKKREKEQGANERKGNGKLVPGDQIQIPADDDQMKKRKKEDVNFSSLSSPSSSSSSSFISHFLLFLETIKRGKEIILSSKTLVSL